MSAFGKVVWVKSSHSHTNGECVQVALWRQSSRCNQGNCVQVADGWRTSSFSHTNGECIEVAGWFKSSRSTTGNCVETREDDRTGGRMVLVRDSKNPGGPVLAFTPGEWGGLLSQIKAGGHV